MTKLLHPPYQRPDVRVGDIIHCAYYSCDVEVVGFSSARAKWPLCCIPYWSGRPIPILTGDLCRAVAVESAADVAAWWGVSRETVTRWRRTLGVGRMNEGTRQLWRELAGRRLRGAS